MIKQSSHILVIEIEKKMTWAHRINKITNKRAKGIYVLSKFRKVLHEIAKLSIKNSFVLLHLRSGISHFEDIQTVNVVKIL